MPQTDKASLTERQQYWLQHIRACDAAGQTRIEYARANGINVHSLYSAKKALAAKSTLLLGTHRLSAVKTHNLSGLCQLLRRMVYEADRSVTGDTTDEI